MMNYLKGQLRKQEKQMTKGGAILALILTALVLASPADARWQHNSDLKAYHRQLRDRIELGQEWGSLSETEVSHLQQYLRGLYNLERRCAASSGLSDNEKKMIWNELEQLDQKITAELHDRPKPGWLSKWDRNRDGLFFWQKNRKKVDSAPYELRLKQITARIVAGVGSRQISPGEASYLNGESARLKLMLERYKQGNGFTSKDAANFDKMLSRMDQRLDQSVRPRANPTRFNSGNWHHDYHNTKHAPGKQLTQPPRWTASKEGGYYDSTGQIKGNIRATDLYRYGGTMSDGRPAPTTPNVHVNTSGHILW